MVSSISRILCYRSLPPSTATLVGFAAILSANLSLVHDPHASIDHTASCVYHSQLMEPPYAYNPCARDQSITTVIEVQKAFVLKIISNMGL